MTFDDDGCGCRGDCQPAMQPPHCQLTVMTDFRVQMNPAIGVMEVEAEHFDDILRFFFLNCSSSLIVGRACLLFCSKAARNRGGEERASSRRAVDGRSRDVFFGHD